MAADHLVATPPHDTAESTATLSPSATTSSMVLWQFSRPACIIAMLAFSAAAPRPSSDGSPCPTKSGARSSSIAPASLPVNALNS